MGIMGWTLVVGINAAIIGWGLWKSRETTRAVDWMLASRGLPWWMVGLSMFATAVDSGDYVAVAGGSYKLGLNNITVWFLGITIGWFLVAWTVFLPMYRSGMFTNAEYLERRFGPSARVISVIVQIIYRTNVLGNVAYSLFLTFSVLTDWGDATWGLVAAIAVGAAIYTATGGLKSVALTDSAQSVVMLVAAIVMWWVVYDAVGGFDGAQRAMHEAGVSQEVRDAMAHVGKPRGETPAGVVIVGWILTLTAYCIVNHSQSMRMLAARSEWDVKMAAVAATVVTSLVMWFNITLGILGRGAHPALDVPDEIFPRLVSEFLVPTSGALAGIVVAGLLAGGISTFDSIGSALAAVFTRDLYARFLVRDADDRHYLWVSRIATAAVIAISFVFVPFLKMGMLSFYLEMIGITVMPLMTVYLVGVFTSAHRSSGLWGLVAGCGVGLARFVSNASHFDLPLWWTGNWYGYFWSIGSTGLAMLVTTLILGPANREELAGLVVGAGGRGVSSSDPDREGRWLEETSRELVDLPRHPFDDPDSVVSIWRRPELYAAVVLVVLAWLVFGVLW